MPLLLMLQIIGLRPLKGFTRIHPIGMCRREVSGHLAPICLLIPLTQSPQVSPLPCTPHRGEVVLAAVEVLEEVAVFQEVASGVAVVEAGNQLTFSHTLYLMALHPPKLLFALSRVKISTTFWTSDLCLLHRP
jgi:hypothetical protein